MRDRHRDDRGQQDQEDDDVHLGQLLADADVAEDPDRQRGICAPAVNVVTITSSNESANASSAPETSAVEMVGKVTYRKVCKPSAPRSIEASDSEVGVRRSRATTLL